MSRARFSKPQKSTAPPKLQAPPSGQIMKPSPSFTSTASLPTATYSEQLISFDSPPSSPTFTQKSNSDCVSVGSFSSDSSPHNGFSTESGFEDDFVLDNFKPYKRMTPVDPFDLLDEGGFTAPSAIRPPIAQKPVNIGGTSSFYASTKPTEVVDETLCNGKNLITTPTVRLGPTIIRAVPSKLKPQAPPKPQISAPVVKQPSDESLDDSPPSPPMPSCPPPPPPAEYFGDEPQESYAIGLFNFEGEQDSDLPFREGEKIYLVRRVNDEWLFGRNRRGCEGMFPANFVEIKIPLVGSANEAAAASSGSSTPSCDVIKVRALYDFNAETIDDLTLRVSSFKTSKKLLLYT